MSTSSNRRSRSVTPRRWVAATAASLAILQPALIAGFHPTPLHASESGEAGEAGEAGLPPTDGPAAFLTHLGYFEGTYRIIATAYLAGQRGLAREHLDLSHHAFYEDIEEELAANHAPGFEDLAAAFAAKINADAPDAEVEGAYRALMNAVTSAAEATGATAYQQLIALHRLMLLAASEYQGGVGDGTVEMAIEYRDSWGFYSSAKARAEHFAAGGDATLAAAAADVLRRMDGLDALYPGLTAQTAAADPSPLAVAAGWIEIIALRTR
ncbi:hypothetical protein [Pseudooceanicola sp.]|uniref:hypothetical protein n=1 Tax=Pseudooceanicola sp. TaxID=1914328 RepID=UPI0026238229|nr:hypothetical protein [Pseudooceanicola sp.]MDF1855994.1 hypothetical protein [Pseudooceanicola sp.]